MAKDFENQEHGDLPEVFGGALEQIRISQQRVQRVLNSPSLQSFLKAQKAIQGNLEKLNKVHRWADILPSQIRSWSEFCIDQTTLPGRGSIDFSRFPQESLNQSQKLLQAASMSVKPTFESMRLAAEASTSMSHKFPAMADLYSPALTRIPIAIGTLQSIQFASIAKSLSLRPIISPLFREFTDLVRTGRLYKLALQNLRDLPESLKELAESGWYLSDKLYNEMPWDFRDIVENRDCEKIDRIIIECLQEQLNSIKSEIIDSYSKRRDALSQAFHAHKQGMYYCSIPVFYSQADGIFKDKFGGGIFMYHKRREVAKNEIELFNKSISYVKSLLSNDADPLPESSWSKDLYDLNYRKRRDRIRRGFLLSNNFHGLERNPIMHGDSGDYGNELKSLKAISFLDWIHCLKRERGSM